MKSIIPVMLLICCAIFYGVDCTSPTKPIDVPDTTSHNFNWQKLVLGDGAGSMLRDVAIINDTLIYAVGEIRFQDSLGNWEPEIYNMAKWNGREWELKRVTVMFRGNPVTVPLEGIFALSSTDIWLAGSIPIRGDGDNWMGYDIQTLVGTGTTVSRMWGTPTEMYFVGRAGNIIRYTSNTWYRVESGTELPIRDIWGAKNEKSGEWEILAIASSTQTDENSLLKILQDNTVVPLNTNGLAPFSRGIWFVPEKRYYIVGSGIHQKTSLNDAAWRRYEPGEVTRYGSSAVSGQGINDVFVAGNFLEVVHYNGSTWYNYNNEIPFSDGVIADIHIRGDTVILVGQVNQQAIAIIGRR